MKLFIPSPACSHCNEVLQGFSSVPWRENRQNWGGLLPFLKERQILRPEGNLPNLAVGLRTQPLESAVSQNRFRRIPFRSQIVRGNQPIIAPQAANGLHLFCRQFEVENLEVLAHMVSLARARNGDNALLNESTAAPPELPSCDDAPLSESGCHCERLFPYQWVDRP